MRKLALSGIRSNLRACTALRNTTDENTLPKHIQTICRGMSITGAMAFVFYYQGDATIRFLLPFISVLWVFVAMPNKFFKKTNIPATRDKDSY